MQTYRLYFRSLTGVIIGRNDLIDTEDDSTALAIAAQLFDACSDLVADFELWYGARLVGMSYARQPKVADARSINAATQARVAQLEELLLDSSWAIAKSKQLLERTRNSRTSLKLRDGAVSGGS